MAENIEEKIQEITSKEMGKILNESKSDDVIDILEKKFKLKRKKEDEIDILVPQEESEQAFKGLNKKFFNNSLKPVMGSNQMYANDDYNVEIFDRGKYKVFNIIRFI